jgi:hypothetical protein
MSYLTSLMLSFFLLRLEIVFGSVVTFKDMMNMKSLPWAGIH